ncbi:flagellar biosynthesis regulator FlaF [Rhodomicrobium vannielii ATCC 17100]|jgi:flagellar protein FlaF|uniref:Flagellar biosynthesis regulator FlaF n=1 Tax=Rhodomicrobium udaipurense TaxID=1202716 RepID=A0A8I1GAA2_9HYPH|nr:MULTISPECIES: flagellar biosynthesis regulator FlaF [Rhodomicrobium]KAI95107.1 flagellar biosynthesis regulator FlhF [Rhodomicrobium udaipurense JA643]MBJ7535918.1 flagellar biosynthesis regulator FlaF [Rhodomicrobium vannielii ATCC 17100]MBJ7541995.1 flagellar biosynthesis regulator FlaF [Rhodomicrobium udaipurense]
MYHSPYQEALATDVRTARGTERASILRSVNLLQRGAEAGPRSAEALEALLYTKRLWVFFIEQLGLPDNRLPHKLRADLISIGIAVLRRIEAIRRGESKDFGFIIDVSRSVAEGLK